MILAAQSAVDLNIFEIEKAGLYKLIRAWASQAACDAIEGFITSEHSDPRTALIDLFKATGVMYHIQADRFIISL